MSVRLFFAVLLLASSAASQDEPSDTSEHGWINEAELSFVATDGNSETSSLGFGGKFERTWTSSRFAASFGGLRARSTDTSRTAVVTDNSVIIEENTASELTAENYHTDACFSRDFAEDWFWHVGGSWERDEFAGIDHRFQGVTGIGHALRDEDDHSWRIDAGATWTSERLTAGGSEEFLGLRLSSDGSRQVTESTKLRHNVQLDENLDQTEDYRIETNLSAQVAISKRLAIKVALQAKYDNQPALEELDVVDGDGNEVTDITVLEPLDAMDLKATVSLVVNF